MSSFSKTARNRVKRLSKRAAYDRAVIYPIVDEALICHVGFVQDGQPLVIPMIHARDGDTLYLHGAKASRLLKHGQSDQPLCITATLLDGIVFARSIFHHSMNYRSAVLFGCGRLVAAEPEKLRALEVLAEHIARGRWRDVRQPSRKELNATSVVAVSIESASAKVRSGPPLDDEEDYALPIWAGVLPLEQRALKAIDDPRLVEGVAVPEYAIHLFRLS